MSNKKIFKEIYSNKINKDSNYKKIITRIENQNNHKIILKRTLIPALSILLIFTLIYINTNEKNTTLEDTLNNYNKDYNTYTSNNDDTKNDSQTSKYNINKKNIDIKELLTNITFLSNINIPKELNNVIAKEVYLEYPNDYNILNHYEITYYNNYKNSEIMLSFSNNQIPLRTNLLKYTEQKYTVNNKDITIYQNESIYITIFTHNNINYNIETNNISKVELINLLTSITI